MTRTELKSAIAEYLKSSDVPECSEFFCDVANAAFEVLEQDREEHYQNDPFPNFKTFTKEEIESRKEIALVDSIIDTISSGSLFQDGDIYLSSVLFIKMLIKQLEV